MSKRMEAARKNYDAAKIHTLEEAAAAVKKNATAKFDETVEMHLRLGIDVKKADQMVRSTVALPHGTGKKKRVAVVAKGEKVKEAQTAGADLVGGADLIEAISKGEMDFDILVSTPDMMKDLARLGKVLGPRGLMPNPKSGTVTFDVERTVKELKAGRIEFKADSFGIVHVPVGKASFDDKKLAENAKAVLEAVLKAKPSTSKGTYVCSAYLSSTMGPSVQLQVAQEL
ncbi:MAG: 50S ribosomal protein L1 [Elusimicrobiales bacterium]|nr:50S ribosomal protein L1 [Elusimicrobiales bacterium]